MAFCLFSRPGSVARPVVSAARRCQPLSSHPPMLPAEWVAAVVSAAALSDRHISGRFPIRSAARQAALVALLAMVALSVGGSSLLSSVGGRVAAAEQPGVEVALRDYVARPDTSYRWEKRREGTVLTATYAELRLTSQTWRGTAWKHQLYVIKPVSAAPGTNKAFLFIGGGSWKPELDAAGNDAKLPREADLLALVAEQVKTPVAILLQVPHQPLFDGKTEDAIIAHTFQEYMKSRDPEWPLLLPMVKSAARAMDAIQEFSKQEWSLDIESFTVSGGSKRGWTTWLTGAVDRRAVAIAPIVIDVLNMGPQMRHQVDTWGEPSAMIQDYTRLGLDKMFDTPNGRNLLRIVDPYSYRELLTQPKLIILGTNDPYWPLDACNLYWDSLPGQKHLLYVPNNGHGVRDVPRLVGSLSALHQQAVTGRPLPKMSWDFEKQADGIVLRVKSETPPRRVSAWTTAAMTRDFRQSQWKSGSAEKDGDTYVCRLPLPADGYAALFGELEFNGPNDVPFYLSTNVRIVGDKPEPNKPPAKP
jgi:PhoPQ-activated pathogenicity-related protein